MSDQSNMERLAGDLSGLLPLESSEQIGVPGKCFTAQVFASCGGSLASMHSTADPKVATERARIIAAACNAIPALLELARVQHSVLKSVQEFDERERQAKWYGRDLDGWLSDEVDEVIAKYKAMMGVRNE